MALTALLIVNNWREQLNRIAVDFWCDVGAIDELPIIADAANNDLGEAHPDIWDFYSCTTGAEATALTLKVALHLNGFVPESWDALPYAQDALKRALERFVGRRMSVQALCMLVEKLDSTFNVYLSRFPRSETAYDLKQWWMGNLWNNCDWCGENRTHENHPSLVVEASRVVALLSEISTASSKRV